MHFKVSAWIPISQQQADGYSSSLAPKSGDLENILAADFPVGTPRATIEKYLLASGDLHPSPGSVVLKSSKRIHGLHLINYETKREYDEGFVGIHAYYNQRDLLTEPLAFEGTRYSFFEKRFDF